MSSSLTYSKVISSLVSVLSTLEVNLTFRLWPANNKRHGTLRLVMKNLLMLQDVSLQLVLLDTPLFHDVVKRTNNALIEDNSINAY